MMLAVGIANLTYSASELILSAILDSLTLFGDGIHNLSDVLALIVAFWADRVLISIMEKLIN